LVRPGIGSAWERIAMRGFSSKTAVLAVGFALAAAMPQVALAASCGTVAAPTACAITVGNITDTVSGFMLLTSLGTGGGNLYDAGDIDIDIATGGGNTLLMTFAKHPNTPTPGIVFLANAGETARFIVSYAVAISPAAPARWRSQRRPS
jgi:hypothetical protein